MPCRTRRLRDPGPDAVGDGPGGVGGEVDGDADLVHQRKVADCHGGTSFQGRGSGSDGRQDTGQGAGTGGTALDREGGDAVLGAAVRRLGYQARLEHVDEHGAVIATPTCPLRPLVRERPEAAEIDRGMWAGLAGAALAGVEVRDVTCETRDCLADHAACRVLVTLTTHRRSRIR